MTRIKKIRKFRVFHNFDKEEQWLNDMVKRGYILTNKKLCYKFEMIDPDQRIGPIKVDYRTFQRREDYEDYLALFEDSGWKHIAGTRSSGEQYFAKVDSDSDGHEEIFSDEASKAARYKRLYEMWLTLAFTYLPVMIVMLATDLLDFETLLNPKLWYFTPGLWESTGVSFWRAFLFETPFALFRVLLWAMFPVMLIISIVFAIKAKRQHIRYSSRP